VNSAVCLPLLRAYACVYAAVSSACERKSERAGKRFSYELRGSGMFSSKVSKSTGGISGSEMRRVL
jgi:hypothetical protein